MPAIAAATIPFWAAATTAGAGIATGVMANKAQGSAARRATDAQRQADDRQMAYLQQRDTAEAAAAARREEEERRRFDQQQKLAQDQWAAQEDERLYKRSLFEEDRAAEVAARDRRASEAANYQAPAPAVPNPYIAQRQALRNQALMTTQQLLAQGYGGNVGNPYAAAPGGQPMTTAELLKLQGRVA